MKNQRKRIARWVLYFALCICFCISTKEAQAANSAKAWQKINGVCYNGSGKKIPGAITRGIDVSAYQGKINWKKVKESNVDFAFIRICHGITIKDTYCSYNLENAAAAGIPVGTYVYSMATTQKEALREALYAIEIMNGYKISYPVVLDLEDDVQENLSADKLAKIANVFLTEIRKAGYYPMVYCNCDWYDERLVPAKLTGNDIWLARFSDTITGPPRTNYNYTIWQATDGSRSNGRRSTYGLIDGIQDEVDLDFGFVDYTKIITPRTSAAANYVPSKLGWVSDNSGTYYYSGNQPVKGWHRISGKLYYFDSSGKLKKNAKITDAKGNISFTDKNGVRYSKGWLTYKKKKYFIRSDGYAVKGIFKHKKKYYYFSSKKAYLLYQNEKVVSPAGNIYYFDSDGARYDSAFLTINENGKKNTYYFGKDGIAYKGWHTIAEKKYFFYSNGVMAKNIKITNTEKTRTYVFNKKGVLVKTIVLSS